VGPRRANVTPEEIRALRLQLGLSQEAFARRLDTALATVNRWEAGKRKPKGLYLKALQELRTEAHTQKGKSRAAA
jgi:putative transcriptional regulator